MKLWCALVMVLGGVTTSACTQHVNACKSDTDCSDIAYPFCDVNGDYAASGGEKGVCTIVPPDCPTERCGCTPGATTCDGDQLTVCNPDGMSTTSTTCAAGCADAKDHCLAFTPSNGLDTPFAGAANQPDVTLTDVVIDTDTGTITGADGPVDDVVVSRAAGNIRVFIAHSFAIKNAEIHGGLAAAFVAATTITVTGTIDAAADVTGNPGPGAQVMPTVSCQGAYNASGGGGGGGGNDIAGGDGASQIAMDAPTVLAAGGAPQVPLTELIGGCYGGGSGPSGRGGGPGGALQFVAGVSMTIAPSAVISLGGGGGLPPSNGGGSGGNIIIETPVLDVEGGIAANGGGGAGCGKKGSDALLSTAPASGGSSGPVSMSCGAGGRGGTGATADSPGQTILVQVVATFQDGGGGSVGRARLATRDGTITLGTTGFVSAGATKASLSLH